MAKRPTLDELYDKLMAAAKVARTKAPGAGAAIIEADQAWLKRCRLTKMEGTTRGGGGIKRPGWAEKIKNDPAIAADYAEALFDDVLHDDVLRRCKEQEGSERKAGREERTRQELRKGAVDLEKASYSGPSAIERKASGKDVVLYHGTSTKFLKKILTDGLVIGRAKVDPGETPGVYLSARYSGVGQGIAHGSGYAERAASRLGGHPVVLTVRVPWSVLEWDTDDEDIASGNWQFVTDFVPPEAIIEIDGKPISMLEKRLEKRQRA